MERQERSGSAFSPLPAAAPGLPPEQPRPLRHV